MLPFTHVPSLVVDLETFVMDFVLNIRQEVSPELF
jgi:hypothetical protein